MEQARQIVTFWREAGLPKWFGGGAEFDIECERFRDLHFSAARGEHAGWLDDALGALAVLLLLDQIPRNLFRGSAHSYATDPLARKYAARVIDAGHDQSFEPLLRGFFYLPFEHSEAMADQDRAVELFEALGNANYLDYACKHRDVIAQFGRFPHRNAALGRESTPSELAYLKSGGGFG